MTIRVQVPGKLYVAGEYAVLTPGQPAILVAVDRMVSVQVQPDTRIPDSGVHGTMTSVVTGGRPVPWFRRGGTVVVPPEYFEQTSRVRVALAIAERFAAEHGCSREAALHLTVSSQMSAPDGRKLGLGSSGAVIVGTIAAVLAARDVCATSGEIYRLSMLALMVVEPHASGGDIATASHGGWVLYHAPNWPSLRAMRDAARTVSELIEADWEGHSITVLPPPKGLVLQVGWTGSPADTPSQTARLSRADPSLRPHLADFERRSRECVHTMAAAFRDADVVTLRNCVSYARLLLGHLEQVADISIMTSGLRALCDGADQVGAVAKSSGAGGGDCGIAFVTSSQQRDELIQAWAQRAIESLELSVHHNPIEV